MRATRPWHEVAVVMLLLILAANPAQGLRNPRQKTIGPHIFRIQADVVVPTSSRCRDFGAVTDSYVSAFDAWVAAAAKGVDPGLSSGFTAKSVALCEDPPLSAAYGVPKPPFRKRVRMVAKTPLITLETALKLVEAMRADKMAGFFTEAAKSAALTGDWKPQFLRYRSLPTIEIPDPTCFGWEPDDMMILEPGELAAPAQALITPADSTDGVVEPQIVVQGNFILQVETYVNSSASCRGSFKEVKGIYEEALVEWLNEMGKYWDPYVPASGLANRATAVCSNPPGALATRRQRQSGLVKRVRLRGTTYRMRYDSVRKVLAALQNDDLQGLIAKVTAKLAQGQQGLLAEWAPQPLRYRSQSVVDLQGYTCAMWDPDSQLLLGGCQLDPECGEMGCSLCEENVCSKPVAGAPCPLDTTKTCTVNATCS